VQKATSLAKQRDEVDVELAPLQQVEDQARQEWVTAKHDAERLVKESLLAAEEVKKISSIPAPGEKTVDQCRNELVLAENRLKAFTAKIKADSHHKSIEAMESLISKVAPDGIRGDVLTSALASFNNSLERFTKAAGWRAVALEPDILPP